MRKPALLALLPLLALAACEMPDSVRPEEEDYFESEEIPVLDRQNLWVVTLMELERAGFRVEQGRTNESRAVFETHWKSYPQPFRYEGKRKKVIGKLEEDEARPGTYKVRLTVWTQRNADLENPMDLSQAIWQDEPPDTRTVKQIMYQIERHFRDPRPVRGGPGEPGEEEGK